MLYRMSQNLLARVQEMDDDMKKCKRCKELESVIQSIWWMARRYADGRQTYAPHVFNNAMILAQNQGVEFDFPDITCSPPSLYAKGENNE